jgi:hypothetical protein
MPKQDSKIVHRCEGMVTSRTLSYSKCRNIGTICEGGSHYCKIHAPSLVKAKREKRSKEINEQIRCQIEARKERNKRESAMQRACEGISTEQLENIKIKDLLDELAAWRLGIRKT